VNVSRVAGSVLCGPSETEQMPDESDDHEDREDDYQGEHPLEESLKQLHADDSTTVGVGPGPAAGSNARVASPPLAGPGFSVEPCRLAR
jgi:hypothetical protein